MSKLPEDINPGIVRTCRWINGLNSNQFRIVGSGDGETHMHECDRDDAYVVLQWMGCELPRGSQKLKEAIEGLGIEVSPIGEGDVWIQANYDPANGLAFIDINGLCDRMLPEGVGNE